MKALSRFRTASLRVARDPPRHAAWVADAVIAAVVLAVSMLPLLGVGSAGCDCPDRPAWAYAAIGAQAIPLIWRRRWPYSTSLVVFVATVAYGVADLPDPVVPFGGLVSLYSVAAYARRELAYLAVATGIAAVPMAVLLSRTHSDALDYVNTLLEIIAAWLLGWIARSHRVQVAILHQRASELRRVNAAEAAVQAAEERGRISREMHDVLAHALTLMVVQAEAGLASNDPATVRASFESIGSTGRGALTELRRVLGALRPTATPSDLAPQPEIADIESLIEQARTSGMPTELNIAGDLSSTPRPVALAAYRIVQESLTNAIRHGGGGPARVGLAAGPRELRIRVDSSAAARPPTVPDGAGRGLQGMRERANALGGALTAGPSPEGGWRVEATLPLRDGR